MKLNAFWISALILSSIHSASAQSPRFEIVTPNFSEDLTNGLPIEITWTSPNGVTNVSLKLMTNDVEGAFIATSLPNNKGPNSGSYTWIVNTMGCNPDVVTNFHLRVQGCDSEGWCGNSDTYPSPGHPSFRILPITQTRMTSINGTRLGNGLLRLTMSAAVPPGTTNYLEYRKTLTTSWARISNSARSSPSQNVNWILDVEDPQIFFRVATFN